MYNTGFILRPLGIPYYIPPFSQCYVVTHAAHQPKKGKLFHFMHFNSFSVMVQRLLSGIEVLVESYKYYVCPDIWTYSRLQKKVNIL